MKRRRARDVDQSLRLSFAGPSVTLLRLAPDGRKLTARAKVLGRSVLLLADILRGERDHFLPFLGLERLAVGFVERVIQAGAIGFKTQLAFREPDRFWASLAATSLSPSPTPERASGSLQSIPPEVGTRAASVVAARDRTQEPDRHDQRNDCQCPACSRKRNPRAGRHI